MGVDKVRQQSDVALLYDEVSTQPENEDPLERPAVPQKMPLWYGASAGGTREACWYPNRRAVTCIPAENGCDAGEVM